MSKVALVSLTSLVWVLTMLFSFGAGATVSEYANSKDGATARRRAHHADATLPPGVIPLHRTHN